MSHKVQKSIICFLLLACCRRCHCFYLFVCCYKTRACERILNSFAVFSPRTMRSNIRLFFTLRKKLIRIHLHRKQFLYQIRNKPKRHYSTQSNQLITSLHLTSFYLTRKIEFASHQQNSSLCPLKYHY